MCRSLKSDEEDYSDTDSRQGGKCDKRTHPKETPLVCSYCWSCQGNICEINWQRTWMWKMSDQILWGQDVLSESGSNTINLTWLEKVHARLHIQQILFNIPFGSLGNLQGHGQANCQNWGQSNWGERNFNPLCKLCYHLLQRLIIPYQLLSQEKGSCDSPIKMYTNQYT